MLNRFPLSFHKPTLPAAIKKPRFSPLKKRPSPLKKRPGKNALPIVLFACLLSFSLGTLGQSLKAQYEIDRLIFSAEDSIQDGSFGDASRYLSQALGIGEPLPPLYYYLQGQIYLHNGQSTKAISALESYINRAGRSAKNYEKTLRQITQLQRKNDSSARKKQRQGQNIANLNWSEEKPAVQDYNHYLQSLYQTESETSALLQHINNLLKFYGYGDPDIKAATRIEGAVRHNISVKPPATLVTTTKHLSVGAGAQQETTSDRFSVYGINPYLTYQCSTPRASCDISNPATGEHWLYILDNESAASELAKAISALIRLLQKSG
ncbi:hypothetical protein GCM10007877_26670 [Marinibactrum halimedae]|uniref:Tetratricopeptide repeat protein n=2 Tax=Marinibactrum halimedae TaxID=1444977 RepID=A0AA37T4H5_9GAMM|nr:hypothetical protein GCM10007877_26670 [Marinibactrum halimedae]